MLVLGAHRNEMREMNGEEILSMRFRLLIIMMKACLDECPMGSFRKVAILRNAQELERNLSSLNFLDPHAGQLGDLKPGPESVRTFNDRLKLLIIMAKSFAGGYPIGAFRRLAIANTLSAITRAVGIDDKESVDSCESVA